MRSGQLLKVLSYCCYLTDGDAWQNPRQDDYDANKMVKALKGASLNGYFHRAPFGRVDDANKQIFVEREVPSLMASALRRYVDVEATLVPIPNSHVTAVSTENFKTHALASRIAAASGGQFTANPLLVFRKPQRKAHEGGPRFASSVEPEYVVTGSTDRPLILIDDVLTSGGHMIAACWKLMVASSVPILGATFGHSVHEQRAQPIELHETDLDLRRFTPQGYI